jgi:NAD-dependent dihydropyrimidine dehydrogenase PreA subunit
MTYVIAEPCIDVKDKSCIEESPVDCIYEGDDPLGSPGGAAKVGPVARDADYIANHVVTR